MVRSDARRAKRALASARAPWLGLILLWVSACVSPTRASDDACAALVERAPAGASQLYYVKAEHLLCLVESGHVAWSRAASHGRSEGKKQFEGDGRTPEGRYTLSPARKSKRFGLFLAISYPNADDLKNARSAGKRAGGAIGIHGPQRWYAVLGQAQALMNHSDGCIVIDATGIHELAERVTRPLALEILAEL